MNNLKLGKHYICDFSGCDRALLMNSDRSHNLFAEAVRNAGLTVVDEGLYKFSPHGFTSFLLLAESHASLHAWPEYGYCAIDLFTCALEKDLRPLIQRLQRAFGAKQVDLHEVDRNARVPNSVFLPLPVGVPA
ncbi:MAG: adenosylmethionine decarboxylase [Anaerolineae bacterium]|nr:adenosylmethionine decarboxylase [Thermoflexales bacterium]MDW8395431.1 adenosylmethionine decarboxylase [Anaerolineae bacterium]